MSALTGYSRLVVAATILMTLAACSTTDVAEVEEPSVAPMTGQTNDPAPGFANVKAGSEEDFILNVGRRTYFTQDSATLDPVAKATLDKQAIWLKSNPQWLVKLGDLLTIPGQLQQWRHYRRDAPMRSWPTSSRRVWTPAACGPRVTAMTARFATARAAPVRCRTGVSSPTCAWSATRSDRSWN